MSHASTQCSAPRRVRGWGVLVAVPLIGSWLFLSPPAANAQADDAAGREQYFDFRGQPLPADLVVLGDEALVRPEKEGLRITLPKDRDPVTSVAIGTRFQLKGDFEITTAFEILHAEIPPAGWGVGVTLNTRLAAPPQPSTNIARLVRPEGQQIVLWDRAFAGPGDKLQFEGNTVPSDAMTGRLRLKRTQTTLQYLWAPGLDGDPFVEIHRAEYGSGDVQRASVNALTAKHPCALDVRILDLRIRHSGPAMAGPAAAPPRGPWKLAFVIILLLLLIGGVAVVVWQQRRAPRSSTKPETRVRASRVDHEHS